MTLTGLIEQFRLESGDRVKKYFWSDQEVIAWFNEAVTEAAIRGRLLHESADQTICQIDTKAGVGTYFPHASLFEIDYLAHSEAGACHRNTLPIVSVERLDVLMPGWRERTGRPRYAVQGDASLRLAPTPEVDGTLYLEGYRLPVSKLKEDEDEPEINAAHHRHLVYWVLHRAFNVPDAERFDPKRSAESLDAFERYFGSRVDSDLRRSTRKDVDHHNEAFFV